MNFDYDTYRYIFIGAAILCGIMLVVTILLFILLKIPKVIGDLSGATAKKAIKNIREQNEASGAKSYKASPVNEARGKLTDKISPSGQIVQQQNNWAYGVNTTKIETQELLPHEVGSETTVLGDEGAGETSVLTDSTAGETSVLDSGIPSGETTVLEAPPVAEETTVLQEPAPVAVQANAFAIEFDITYIHTNEVIME